MIAKSEYIDFDKENLIKFESPDPYTRSPVGTRSHLGVKHTVVTFENKPRKIKMAVNIIIKLDEVMRLIPTCSGEDDIFQFINACDLAIDPVEKKYLALLVKYINTRLSGRALEKIKYKDASKWEYIRKDLTDAFEVQH